MKNAFVFKVLSLFTILSLMFSGVFAGGVQRVSAASSDLSVGIVLPVAYGHWLQDQASFQERIQASGLAAEVLFSDGDAATEKANVEYLISKGIKVLIITPQDSSANAAVLEEAQAAGVKIICYDRLVRDTEAVDFYITFDNVGAGRAMGQYLINHAQGSGNPLYLYAGAAYDNNSYLFFEGAWEVLQPKIADGTFSIKNSNEAAALQNNATLTRDQESAIINQINTNWDYSTAQALAAANLNAMAADEKGNVFILAPNDNTARAIADVFMTDPDVTSYVITGQDAERDSIQYIIDGKQSMTVFKDFRTTVDDALAAAKVFLDGSIPIASTTANNGMIDVPTKLSAVTVVDKSNFKSVLIDSGYYQDSDFIYHHPTILANPSSHWVHALDWPINTELNLTIGDYSATTTTVVAPWDPNTVDGYFDLTGQVDLAPGDVVTVTGEGITKTLTIANFAVSKLDLAANTLSGIASPGGFVCAGADNAPRDARCATAGADGIWNIEPLTGGFVLGAGVAGWAVEFDPDGDQTRMDWRVPNPGISAFLSENRVDTYDWPLDDNVILTITGNGESYSDSLMTTGASWDNSIGYANFKISNFVLEPGQIITVSNGDVTKSMKVMDLYVSSFDYASKTVTGYSDPNAQIDVNVWVENGGYQVVSADGSGYWHASYDTNSSPFFPWTSGDVTSRDANGNASVYRINMGQIYTWPEDKVLRRGGCTPYRIYTLSIDDIHNGKGVDHNDIRQCNPVGDETYGEIDFPLGDFSLDAGDVIEVSSGHDIRTLVVFPKGNNISFSEDYQIVSGINTPNSYVMIIPPGSWDNIRNVPTDASGMWVTDFSKIGANGEPVVNLMRGDYISVQQYDAEGNIATYSWHIPNPRFDVRANIDQVEGYEWKIGESVTLQVGDYSETKTVEETASWDSNLSYVAFNLSGKYDIQAGDVVTLTNGTITKTTTVTLLEITDFDRTMDTVSGKAAPNTNVNLWGCDADNCYNRHVTADESGNWLADFANPGSADDEQNTLDIVSGTWVDSQQVDDDGDTTMYGRNVPTPTHHIYTYNIKTGEVIQITNIPNTSEWNPSWSPNGKQIAHDVSFEDGTQAIYITDVRTQLSTPLKGAEGGNDAVWSPNGQWIAFDTNYTDTPNLYLVSPSGGEKKLIRENAIAPSWSPNSQRIVFKDLSDGGKLKTIDLVDGLEITVADRGENPAWSPDGKWIAYTLDGDIWKVRIDPFGTPLAQPIQLTNLDGWEDQPAWSMDSKTIVFQSGSSIDDYDLWSVPADGGIPVPLYGTLQVGEYDPDFAHNGLIVFSGPVIVP